MSASSRSSALSGDHSGDHRGARAHRTDRLIQHRRATALALTVFSLALGGVLLALAGRDAFFIYFFQLPLALTLLWASTSAKRFDEGEEAMEIEPTRIETMADAAIV